MVALLELTAGMTVVDLGAGSGYFACHLSRAVGSHGKVVGRWFWNDRWSSWYSHRGPDLDPGAGLAALSREREHMELYAIGTDGNVYGTWFWHDQWHDWFSLGAPAGHRFAPDGRLAAVSRDPRHMEVFGVTADGGLWSRWWWDGTWHDWNRLDDGGLSLDPRGGVAATSRSPEHMEVFVVDGHGTARGRWFWNGWQSWFAMAASVSDRTDRTSAVALVSRADWHMELFVTALSGRVAARVFLAGSGWAAKPFLREDCSDSIAWTEAATATPETFTLEFLTDGGRWGDFRSPRLTDIFGGALDTGCLEVPVEGFSAHGQMYVFHSTQGMQQTVLAHARGEDLTDLRVLYQVSDHTGCSKLEEPCTNRALGRFINVSCVAVSAGHPASPFTGATLFVWGSGHYRQSHVYLAAVPLDSIANRQAWRYFTGTPGEPWSVHEAAATPVVVDPTVGELNVTWNEPLRHWLLLYNSDRPVPSVVGRIAPSPWGPWSEPAVVFDLQAMGLGVFLHRAGSDDHLDEPGRPEGGGCYGPYVIDRFTRPAPGTAAAQIWFLMSTWNPYQAMLMRAVVRAVP